MDDVSIPTRLGDYVDLQRGNTYKSSLLGLPGPVLLGLASIARNGGFKSDNLKTYGGHSDPRMLLEPGDIYVSLKDVTQSADLLGAVSRVPENIHQGRLTQDTVKLTFKTKTAPKDYIYWSLRTPQYREYCRAHATGTTNLGLRREDFLSFPIPALTSARADLVTLLQALDDKIDLNRRTNETLEAMARATFKDWFVDFGPTRSKMEGRTPYLAPDIWALFPDKLDEKEKPERWSECYIDDLAELNPSERLPQGTLAPYIDMAALPVRGSWLDAPIMREAGSGARFRNGDTLFARITPCLENGKTAYVTCLRAGEIAWGSTEFILIRPRPPVPPEFGYLLARDDIFRAHAIQSMTGTSGRQRVQPEALRSFSFVRTSDQLFASFGVLVSAIFSKISGNAKENETLAATRDLLLPKLMSGEIRVKEAEKLTAEVA